MAIRNSTMDELRAGGHVCGAWLFFREPTLATLAARAGYDFVCVDGQHGLQGTETIYAMLQAAASAGATPVARAPSIDPAAAGRLLDAGAQVIIFPMVDTAEDCAAALAACCFAPHGNRSNGAIGAATLYGGSYTEAANAAISAIPMIETRKAYENLDAILAVDGLEAIFVGPADLRMSLELTGAEHEETFVNLLSEIAERCAAKGIIPGIYATPGNVADRLKAGYRLVSVATDWDHVTRGLQQDMDVFEAARDKACSPGS